MQYKTKFLEGYNSLNSQQKEAVDTIEGSVMVLAGPGTGKTQIIALRIANILEKTQLNPGNILCLTFTENAAINMRKRLLQFIGSQAYHVNISTFHSFCNYIIRDNPEKFNITYDMEALTDVDSIDIYINILESLPFDSPLKPFGSTYFYLRDCQSSIQSLKREDISPKKFKSVLIKDEKFLLQVNPILKEVNSLHWSKVDDNVVKELIDKINEISSNHPLAILSLNLWEDYNSIQFKDIKSKAKACRDVKLRIKDAVEKATEQLPKQFELVKIYEKYQQELKEKNKYDYEDMVLFLIKKFKEDEEFLRSYQEKFQYILVDEYQDTNESQNEIIDLLGNYFDNPNIFVVGDDDQSIFRFQGASLQNLISFYNKHKEDLKIITLQDNYRSTQTILDSSKSIIENNNYRIGSLIPSISKSLKSHSTEGTKINIYEMDNPVMENIFIANTIKDLIKSGEDSNDIAIIYRNNSDSEDLIDLFQKEGIPYQLERGENILLNNNIQSIINILRYLDDISNDVYLYSVLTSKYWNINKLDLMKISRAAYEAKTGIFNLINDEDKLLELKIQDTEKIKGLLETLSNLYTLCSSSDIVSIFKEIINQTNIIEYINSQENKSLELLKLSFFFDEIKFLHENKYSLHQFISYLNILEEHNIPLLSKAIKNILPGVRLITTHSAKGLEFNTVFIYKSLDQYWGNTMERNRIKLPLGLITADPRISNTSPDEEDRRLFYVALTRAKTKTYITYSLYNNKDKEQIPSRFIEEINPEYINYYKEESRYKFDIEDIKEVFQKSAENFLKNDEKAYTSSLLENYILNANDLNLFLDCPHKFYENVILKTPHEIDKNIAYNISVQKTLTQLFKEGTNIEKENIEKILSNELKKHELVDVEFQDALKKGTHILSNYFAHTEHHSINNSLLSVDFNNHASHIDNYLITGRVDRINYLDNQKKQAEIIEYKVANPDTTSEYLKPDGRYRRELIFYKLLAESSLKLNLKIESLKIAYIEESRRSKKLVTKEINISDQEIADFKQLIKSTYQSIINLEFEHKNDCNCLEKGV